MVEIGGRPILWHILKTYSSFGINEFVTCCGYKGYVIKEYFANYFLHMSDVTFHMRTNSMEVQQKNAEPWEVTLVDTGEATLTAVQPPSRYGALNLVEGDQVAGFQEKPQGDGGWINGGFFVLEPGVFDTIHSDDTSWEGEPLQRLAAEGQLQAYLHHGFWQPMDTLRDQTYLEELWESGKAP
jgi:glucose-1-phosphate cytidylyltransferase